jgi:hypothetical protein
LLIPVSVDVAAAPTLPADESVVEFSERLHATSAALSISTVVARRPVTTFPPRMRSPLKKSIRHGSIRRAGRGRAPAVRYISRTAALAARAANR